jgi:hypothetical protein
LLTGKGEGGERKGEIQHERAASPSLPREAQESQGDGIVRHSERSSATRRISLATRSPLSASARPVPQKVLAT